MRGKIAPYLASVGVQPRFAPAQRRALPNELRPGALLRLRGVARPLRIVRRLDGGSHSVVYGAVDARGPIAVSVAPHTEHTQRAYLLQRAAKAPSVAPLFAYVHERNTGYTLASWAVGGALDRLLLSARQAGIKLPLGWRLMWFKQSVAAVMACHARGIIHYDVTPANILLFGATPAQLLEAAQRSADSAVAAGRTSLPSFLQAAPAQAKISDFSLASRAAVADGRGTISSLPPEALWGIASGAAQDLFALGCLLFALVVGSEPYDDVDERVAMRRLLEDTPSVTSRELMLALRRDGASDEVAWALGSLAAALLVRDPSRRPSAQAVHVVLDELLG